jgi:hypothetical protein
LYLRLVSPRSLGEVFGHVNLSSAGSFNRPFDGSIYQFLVIFRWAGANCRAGALKDHYKSIMRSIYSPGEYNQRALNCLERVVTAAPAARRNGIASDVVTLFRIVLALGVRDRARRVLELPTPRPYPASREVGGGDDAGRGGLSLSQANRRLIACSRS